MIDERVAIFCVVKPMKLVLITQQKYCGNHGLGDPFGIAFFV
jgi:hypothetical protein